LGNIADKPPAKLSESLSYCGDLGKWFLGLACTNPDYHPHFLTMIDTMFKMKAKIWDKAKAAEVQKKLVTAAANLEIRLPVYWNNQCRHMLICRFVKQLNDFGSFWAQAMLVIEMYHCLVKSCGRSNKNFIASFLNNYSLFDVTQLEWRFEIDALPGVTDPNTLAECMPRDYTDLDETIDEIDHQKRSAATLGDKTYLQILKLYGQHDLVLSSLVEKYAKDATGVNFVHLDKWNSKGTPLTLPEKNKRQGFLPEARIAKVTE
jgi:hypothetical protein